MKRPEAEAPMPASEEAKGCHHVRARLLSGQELDDAALAHVAQCPACAELAAEDGVLAKALCPTDDDEAVDPQLLARIHEAIEADSTWQGQLKSRPTWQRIGVAFATALLTAGVIVYLLKGRGTTLAAPVLLALTSLAVLAAGSLALSLRPAQSALLRPKTIAGATSVLLLVLLGLSVLPAIGSPQGGSHAALPCLLFGLVAGVPTYAIVRLLDRGLHTALNRVLGAVAAGIAGNAALMLSCPATNAVHLVSGHFMVAICFVAAAVSMVLFGRTVATDT